MLFRWNRQAPLPSERASERSTRAIATRSILLARMLACPSVRLAAAAAELGSDPIADMQNHTRRLAHSKRDDGGTGGIAHQSGDGCLGRSGCLLSSKSRTGRLLLGVVLNLVATRQHIAVHDLRVAYVNYCAGLDKKDQVNSVTSNSRHFLFH